MRNYWSLRSSDVFVGLIVLSQTAFAQFSKPDSLMPSGKARPIEYLFPIQPGKTAMLNGTMGELRSSHFHGGLDINTVTIGYAVRCANDGYVARASVSTGGYGKAVYIKHEDGNTTLYGHLDQFRGSLGDYVRQERYRRKQSEIDLYFTPNQFPVKRGDTIAVSGNTGSSGGPHLHFELRSPQDEALNPMVLDFPEVQDHVPPIVQKLALKTLDIHSRINDQFGRFEFHLSRNGEDYILHQPILAIGRIGIEIQAYDKQENSRFKCGINRIEVWADEEKVFAQTIDKINFRESRNILAVMDFKVMETKGARFNKLYVDDGNRLPYYSGTTLPKGIHVQDNDVALEVRLTDYHGNTSVLNFTLQPSSPAKNLEFLEPATGHFVADMQDNVLTFTTQPCSSAEETLEVFSKGASQKMSPAYSGKQKNVFLIDLNNVLPDSLKSCSGTWVSNFKDRIPSGTKYKYFSDLVEMEFNPQTLYDTLYLTTAYDSTAMETFTIGQRTVPLFLPVKISIKPQKEYNMAKNLGLYRKEGNGFTYLNSAWKNGKINFSTLSLGDFSLLKDTIPPTIKPLSMNGVVARLRIKDNLSGISYFEGNIDGKWLLMNYDHKTGIIYSERPDRINLLQGDFELKIVDNAGNETIFRQRIP